MEKKTITISFEHEENRGSIAGVFGLEDEFFPKVGKMIAEDEERTVSASLLKLVSVGKISGSELLALACVGASDAMGEGAN